MKKQNKSREELTEKITNLISESNIPFFELCGVLEGIKFSYFLECLIDKIETIEKSRKEIQDIWDKQKIKEIK